jgi:4-hydroxybutyrate dehydrogenase
MTVIWSYPTRILFGIGAASLVGEELRRLGVARPLIVTDPGVVRAGVVDGVKAALAAADMEAGIFGEVEANPSEQNVDAACRAFSDHDADSVVGIGGGSALDVSKLVAVRAQVSLPWEELDDTRNGGVHIPATLPPVVTLPTTAGTGSEVGRAAVLTVASTGRKTVVFSPHMLAKAAILDPELTRTMPPRTTAATGFDALTHCLEAYLARGEHPMADAIALGGLELIGRNLEQAVRDGNDLAARGAMLNAAMMGAVAFQKGLGACHSLAHPLSSECGLHHGLANALCLPAVVEFNAVAVPERVARVCAALGGPQSANRCAELVRDLRSRVGLPSGLAEVGVTADRLPKLADLAIQDGCHAENPRPCSREELLRLYEASM